jgi:hypothetical protein
MLFGKKEGLKYLTLGLVFAGLIGSLFFLRGGLTGYAFFENSIQGDFDNGTYINTIYNGSLVVLSGDNLTGSFTSQIFDAGNEAVWNNISWVSQIASSSNSLLTSAMHLDENRTDVFVMDSIYYTADMKTSNDRFYLNFSDNLINGSVLKIYAKRGTGKLIGIYAQSDVNGDDAFGIFTIDSNNGDWYNITLSIDSPTNAIWIGEGTGSGNNPKDDFDYIFAEIPGSSLNLTVRSCDDVICSGESWIDIDDESPKGLSLDNNTYFQYRFEFERADRIQNIGIFNVTVDYSPIASIPNVNINDPQTGAVYGYNESLSLNFFALSNNLDSCWYSLDGGINNVSIINCDNTTFDISTDGIYNMFVYSNESILGLEGFDNVSFTVAIGSPSILLNFPVGNYLNYQDISFNYTPTDTDLDSCEIWGDFTGEFKLNKTDTGVNSGVVNSFNLNLTDNAYLWNIQCNDTQGNTAFNGNQTFYVDTFIPNVTLNEPDGTKSSRTEIPLTFSVSDKSPLYCSYNLTSSIGTLIIGETEVAGCISSNFNVSADGDYIFNLKVNDSAGNSDFSSSSFSVDTVGSSNSNPGGSGGSSGSSGSGGSSGSSSSIGVSSNSAGILPEDSLKVSNLGRVISKGGGKEILSIGVLNSGRGFLNECRLLVDGVINSWIYSKQIEGIAPGENVNFVFDLNVPEEVDEGEYSGKLEVNCKEGNAIQEIVVVVSGLSFVEIKDVNQDNKNLEISYVFDSSSFVGDSVSLDLWITDVDGFEIFRTTEVFDINKEVVDRVSNIELENELVGIYYVYFALSSDLSNFVRKSIVLGDSEITGRVIFGTTAGKFVGYIVFVFIVALGVFFVIRKRHAPYRSNKSRNKWLLRKKGWLR